MNRKTQIALAVFGVLALVTVVTLRQPEKGERVGERPRPIPTLKTGDFDTLAVTKGGKTAVIKKAGDKFTVADPAGYPADEAAAKQAFEAVEKMDFGDVVTDKKEKQAEFELDDKAAVRLAVKKGDKVLADLLIGKSVGGGVVSRRPDKDEIWMLKGMARHVVDKAAADWRDKSITTYNADDAESIDIKSKTAGRIVLKKGEKKEGAEAEWKIVESTPKIDKMDKAIAGGLVQTMASWKANDFADAAKPEETGLTDPQLTVTVGLKGGKSAVVLIGNKKGEEDFYVKRGDAPQVFMVKKFNLDRINKRPVEFRDKTICDIAEADITEVAVTHGADSYTLAKDAKDKTWKAAKPPKMELDTSKTPNIVGGFKDLKAASFAEDSSTAVTGLGKPKAVVVAKGKASTCALKIGNETSDKQNYYVQSGVSPDVYLIGKWAIDRALVKVDDLKKPGTNLAKK
ncbi:MAG TPA: DUF4340 domain-containing protein [Polyangia bacterium]|jgi:hypothetical protein|nr:DUF4340 domain-containing protein [Polyangia bacterium]